MRLARPPPISDRSGQGPLAFPSACLMIVIGPIQRAHGPFSRNRRLAAMLECPDRDARSLPVGTIGLTKYGKFLGLARTRLLDRQRISTILIIMNRALPSFSRGGTL
jgi:hypothetical protein